MAIWESGCLEKGDTCHQLYHRRSFFINNHDWIVLYLTNLEDSLRKSGFRERMKFDYVEVLSFLNDYAQLLDERMVFCGVERLDIFR